MSVLSDGKVVCCDGHGCRATASLPVALRSTRNDRPGASAETDSISGWLFARGRENSRHFCPDCISRYLPQVMEGCLGHAPDNFYREREDAR